jgi:hypothetical protein
MDLVTVWLEELCDEGFSGTSNVVGGMLQTEVVYPSRYSFNIGFFGNVSLSETVRIKSRQKSLDPTKDKSLPPNGVYIIDLPRLGPHIGPVQFSASSLPGSSLRTPCSRWSLRRTCHVEEPLSLSGLCQRMAPDLVCDDWLFSFVMRKRLHKVAITECR